MEQKIAGITNITSMMQIITPAITPAITLAIYSMHKFNAKNKLIYMYP